ncbi:MAG: hypothetical protein H6Q48_515 [Deltaproteobacteria bacterium]|jgi:hypothetical protein|nr:hypothetical protein [Deltaproteobacteria bacterium]
MNDSGPGKGNDSRVSNGKRSKDEWTKIVDRVEAAILISLANKVLAEAVVRQNEIDEHRKQLKLVELKNFSRRTYAG